MENLGYKDSTQKMLEVAKRCLEIWHRLVHITGGELELKKSSYSLMNWKLNDGKEKMCEIRDSPGHLSLQSEKYKGLEVELRRNEVTFTEMRLGISDYQCLEGTIQSTRIESFNERNWLARLYLLHSQDEMQRQFLGSSGYHW